MDAEAIKWVLSQGIGAVLALVMFLVYRRDVHNALNSWQQQTRILTDLVKECTAAMQNNTYAVQANTESVQAMERKLPHVCPMVDQVAGERPAPRSGGRER